MVEFEASSHKDARKRSIKDRDEVWVEYLHESTGRDNEMLEACNKNMDVLLIFAGLFSAVLTAFTVISYTQLQPNPNSQTNALLAEISQQLSASIAGSSINMTNISSTDNFTPPQIAIRLNVLWFSSLTCSLLAALGAVLAKQWMVEYPRGAPPSATPCERAQHRQVRFTGITTWHFLAVIDFLPTLIQLAFLLFFIGLCDFLFTLHIVVGSVVAVLCGLGFLFVMLSAIASMTYPSCPFRTPFSTSLGALVAMPVKLFIQFALGPVEERYNLWYSPVGWRGLVIKGWKWIKYGHPCRVGNIPRWALNKATTAEDGRLDAVNAEALAWLMHWVAKEDTITTTASLIPGLPISDIRAPLVNALPRFCTLFQSYFVIDGEIDCLCPRIIPKFGQAEEVITLGRAIHRIMICHHLASRATRVIGDVFGDAFLVFPPGVHSDVHILVCCLVATDPSFYRRYSQPVREQLFISLFRVVEMSPWALTMILDSLCSYLLNGPRSLQVSPQFTDTVLSILVGILQPPPSSAEVSSAIGLAFKVVLDGALELDILLRDKLAYLPQNLLIVIAGLTQRLESGYEKYSDISLERKGLLEQGLAVILRVAQRFASDKDLMTSFLDIRPELMTLLRKLLLRARSFSTAMTASVVAAFHCYPDDSLPFGSSEVEDILPIVVTQLRIGCGDDDLKSTLHLIGRLIDINGTAKAKGLCFDDFGKTLVDVLKRPEPDGVQLAVLQSLGRHARFWFETSELLRSLEDAGIHDATIRLLSSPRPEEDLVLTLIIADHLAPVSTLRLLKADPQLVTFTSALDRKELKSYTRQICATVMLRLVFHLSESYRTQVFDRSDFLGLARDILVDDIDIKNYVVEDWCQMSSTIAETHEEKLVASGFLGALEGAAKRYGCGVKWIR